MQRINSHFATQFHNFSTFCDWYKIARRGLQVARLAQIDAEYFLRRATKVQRRSMNGRKDETR